MLPNNYKLGLGIRSDKGDEDYIPFACHFEILISALSSKDKSNTRKGILVPRNKIEIFESPKGYHILKDL